MLEIRSSVIPFSLPQSASARTSPQTICHLIATCVACDFGLDAAELETRMHGSKRLAFARQVAMYLAHVGCGLALSQVGLAFGRDRTTVRHACALVEDRRSEPGFELAIGALEAALMAVLRRFEPECGR